MCLCWYLVFLQWNRTVSFCNNICIQVLTMFRWTIHVTNGLKEISRACSTSSKYSFNFVETVLHILYHFTITANQLRPCLILNNAIIYLVLDQSIQVCLTIFVQVRTSSKQYFLSRSIVDRLTRSVVWAIVYSKFFFLTHSAPNTMCLILTWNYSGQSE